MKYIIEVGALIGGSISILAYWPQIRHLIKVKNSTGISLSAWYAWSLSNLVLLAYAIYIKDIVFTILEVLFVFLCLSIVVLTYKYRIKKWKYHTTGYRII